MELDPSTSDLQALGESPVADANASYAVKLPIFEGPLDLLLHLIRLNEVEITEIPIASICEQYLAHLELMRELNIDVAAEYLVMAATLAWIKSTMLLPSLSEGEDDEGIDPRDELVRRLLEYQRYKEVADQLSEVPRLGRDVYSAQLPDPEPLPEGEREVAVDLSSLLEALQAVLRSAPHSGAAHELFTEPITVRERMVSVMDTLEAEQAIEFIELLRGAPHEVPTRSLIVATFLAILELARLGVLRIYQGLDETGAPEGPIRVRSSADSADSDWSHRISELM